jgi:pimeloyl-ACP methyl ester carboxylesterase
VTDARTVVAGRTVFLLREWGSGPGPAVLLLHGVPETSACWEAVAPALGAGRRVLAPDLPGLGGSTFTGPYAVDALVDELVALLDAEGLDRVDVAGHDWGGVLALTLAGRRPGRVRRLAVLNAPYRVPAPLWRTLHLPLFSLPLVPDLLFRVGGRQVVRAMLAAGWGSGPALDPQRREEYEAAYAPRAAVRAMLGYYRAAVRPQWGALRPGAALRGLMPTVSVPDAVVVWGARDPALPLVTGQAVTRDLGPDARMVSIPGAGHFVVDEAPEVVGEVLREAFG